MRIMAALIVIGALAGASTSAMSQDYPTRPIRLVVPYGPGGASDQLARAVGNQLGTAVGQPVIIDNKGGGGTIIGTDFVAKSVPDGYTIGLATFANLVSNPLLAASLPYKPEADFDGIGFLATSPMVMVVAPELPVKTVREFVAYAKANPNRINYGSSGAGSTVHLAAELFKSYAGVEMVHVPFKSSPEVIAAIAGGFIQMAFDVVISSKPHLQTGKLRALAVTEGTRTALMPDVPTIAESGYPQYAANTWYGLIAPRGTPTAAIQRLNTELGRILKDPALQKKFEGFGMELKSSAAQALLTFAAAEREKWGKIVAAQGLKAKQ